jgi:endonuclease YncB( thermonuclease family)
VSVTRSGLVIVTLAAVLLTISPSPTFAQEEEIVPPPSRDVTPPGVTPAPVGPGPLVREPVALPIAPVPAALPPMIKPILPPAHLRPGWHRFVLPETTDAATFVVSDLTIRIAGVIPLPREASCHNAADEDWPCGDVALEEFRHFLLGRPVYCFLGADKSNSLEAPCRVGRTDLGTWLLVEGWAKAASSASQKYRQAADDARCSGRGLWHGVDERPECMTLQDSAE